MTTRSRLCHEPLAKNKRFYKAVRFQKLAGCMDKICTQLAKQRRAKKDLLRVFLVLIACHVSTWSMLVLSRYNNDTAESPICACLHDHGCKDNTDPSWTYATPNSVRVGVVAWLDIPSHVNGDARFVQDTCQYATRLLSRLEYASVIMSVIVLLQTTSPQALHACPFIQGLQRNNIHLATASDAASIEAYIHSSGPEFIAFFDLSILVAVGPIIEKLALAIEGKDVDAATGLTKLPDDDWSNRENEMLVQNAWQDACYDGGALMIRYMARISYLEALETWLGSNNSEGRARALQDLYHSIPRRFTLPEYLQTTQTPHKAMYNGTCRNRPMNHDSRFRQRDYASSLNIGSTDPFMRFHAAATQHPSVLMIVPWLVYGGADQFNINLARAFSRRNIHVVVTTSLPSAHQNAQEMLDITPDVFHTPHFVNSKRDRIMVLAFWKYLVTSRNVKLIFLSHSALGYKMLPLLYSMKTEFRGVQLVDFLHLVELEWGGGGYAAMSLQHQRHLDHTFVASKHLFRWMIRHGAGRHNPLLRKRRKIRLAYIGVDADILRPLSANARYAVRQRIFGQDHAHMIIITYVARMEDQKNPGLYFEIARRLVTQFSQIRSIAIGDGPHLRLLQRNITQRGLSGRIVSFSALRHGQVAQILGASDVLILPSRNEGVALVAYEAMALGVVPVVTAVGGQCELVTPAVGACLPFMASNEAKVAQAFVREISREIVPNLAALRNSVRSRIVSEFSIDKTIGALTDAICARGVKRLV